MVMTFAPFSSAEMEAQQPARPAPITSTSHSSVPLILSLAMGSGAISQLCFPATSGPAEAPLSATGTPALAARGGIGLGVRLRLGRAAGHAGHGRTGERRAAQAQERATRQALLPHTLLFLHENPSLI